MHADQKIIERYLAGDASAFARLDVWARTEIQVRFPVLRNEIDDLSQTVHTKLVRVLKGEAFRHQSSLKTYVVRLTRYTCVDRIRAWNRTQFFEAADRSTGGLKASGYRNLFRAERRVLLRQIILLAPAMCRDLWRLAYVQALSYEEIGRRLSLPQGTIKSRMWACRRRAVALLERLGDH